MDNLENKLTSLQKQLADFAIDGRFALAFSGGIDSRFIAHIALLAGLKPLLIHAVGPHIASEEIVFAQNWALSRSADFCRIQVNPLEVPEIAANDSKRCYYCKRVLFTRLKQAAQGLPLCDGTQSSDLQGYRPGLAALQELGVVSPLLKARLNKKEIRQLATRTAMDFPDQRARPCLLTRFAYGLQPNPEQLVEIDKAEQAIEKELRDWVQHRPDAVLADFRLRRLSPDHIELHLNPVDKNNPGQLPEELRQKLETAIHKEIGLLMRGIKIMRQLSGYFDRESL